MLVVWSSSQLVDWILSTEVGLYVLLRDGVRKQTLVLLLRSKSGFQRGALCRIGQCRFGCLSRRLQRVLALYVLRVRGLTRIDKVDTQLLFLTRTTLEIQALRFVEFAPHAGKHTMQCDLSHFR